MLSLLGACCLPSQVCVSWGPETGRGGRGEQWQLVPGSPPETVPKAPFLWLFGAKPPAWAPLLLLLSLPQYTLRVKRKVPDGSCVLAGSQEVRWRSLSRAFPC